MLLNSWDALVRGIGIGTGIGMGMGMCMGYVN